MSLITELIGRICFNRHETIYWSVVGRRVLSSSVEGPIWRKIGRRLINQQNTLYLEGLLRQLLLNAENHEQVEWYLGADLTDSTDDRHGDSRRATIRHLLTNKFLLISYSAPFEGQSLIENLIGCLAHRSSLFESTLHNVLSVWSNASLVRHQTKDQHYYLCRILACSLRHMTRLGVQLESGRFLSVILHGAETHLKLVEPEKRNSGLFVVQHLANYMHKHNEKLSKEEKLDFDVDLNDKAIGYLNAILEGKQNTPNKRPEDLDRGDETAKKEADELEDNNNQEEQNDDDLVPYDMSDDRSVLPGKRPIYLKDCLEGLMNTEDVEYNAVCLECLPELIEKNRSQASELSVDFIRVLLFLDCEEDAEAKRLRARSMVRLCSLDPTKSAAYLTGQLYDQNLSIVRKLDLLDTIVESARQLSSSAAGPLVDGQQIKSIQNIVRERRPEYERIIEERVKAKTRYLCPTASAIGRTVHRLPADSPNEFVQHVNHFFYPLINQFDRKEVALRFNEDDHFVLGKLIVTLAELLKAVSQTHVTPKMAVALVDFLNAFKNHPESYVRKSITIAIHSILSNVPSFFLFEELQADLLSFRDFLVAQKQLDPETFHSHGVLVLYTLEERLNSYQVSLRTKNKMSIKI